MYEVNEVYRRSAAVAAASVPLTEIYPDTSHTNAYENSHANVYRPMSTTDVDVASARARARASARETVSARAGVMDTLSERVSARDIWGFVSARDRARAREEGGEDMGSLYPLPSPQSQPRPHPRSPDRRGAHGGNGNGNGGGNGSGILGGGNGTDNGGGSGGIARTRQLFGPPRRGPRTNTNK